MATRNEGCIPVEVNLRLALITTGLRPAAHAFATLPGRSVGIIRWDGEAAIARDGGVREHPLARALIARARRRPYASLAHLAASASLRYKEIGKADATTLRETLAEWRIDLVISSGCPLIPMSALENLPHGGINLHPSLLPRYRGPDPLFWQVAEGASEIGVSVHRLAAGSDTGAILGSRSMRRPRLASRSMLFDALEGSLGVPLLGQVIADIERGAARPIEQPERSPTRYARAVPRKTIASEVPLDGIDMTRCQDLVSFLGECPPDWLDLRSWQRAVCWKPWRIANAKTMSCAADVRWQSVRGTILIGLQNRNRVLWFRPFLRRS